MPLQANLFLMQTFFVWVHCFYCSLKRRWIILRHLVSYQSLGAKRSIDLSEMCQIKRYNNVVLKEHQKAVDNDITTTTTNNNNNNDNDINDYNLTFAPDLN